MKIKCPNCLFENDPSTDSSLAEFPCQSCGKTITAPKTATSQGPPPLPVGQTGNGQRQMVSSILDTAALFARRIFRSNLHSEKVSAHEVGVLEKQSPPICSPIAQSYLGWRRALLWFGGLCLAVAALIDIPEVYDTFDQRRTPGILKFIAIIFLLSKTGAAGLAILAATRWHQVLPTRTYARFSWICLFVLPLLLGLIPIAYFIDARKMGVNSTLMSFQFGAVYFILLTPALLGLFPGIVRSALTMKTMLPESQMPGWIALVISPLYALFLAIGLVIAAQAQDFLVSATFIAFIAAPVLVILNGRRLITPTTAAEMMTNMTILKRLISIAYGIGLILSILVALRFLNKIDVSFFDVTRFIATLIGNLFIVTVVVSDLLLTLFKQAFAGENHLRENNLLSPLAERFESLDEIGLTRLGAGEGDLLKGIRNRFNQPPDNPA